MGVASSTGAAPSVGAAGSVASGDEQAVKDTEKAVPRAIAKANARFIIFEFLLHTALYGSDGGDQKD